MVPLEDEPRVLEIEEIKTVQYVPLSHPFVERLIGTIRREYLDHTPFWNGRDLERKLGRFKDYCNRARTHGALGGQTPITSPRPASPIGELRWQSHCRGLYQLAVAA